MDGRNLDGMLRQNKQNRAPAAAGTSGISIAVLDEIGMNAPRTPK
jgi:hypothetical protein